MMTVFWVKMVIHGLKGQVDYQSGGVWNQRDIHVSFQVHDMMMRITFGAAGEVTRNQDQNDTTKTTEKGNHYDEEIDILTQQLHNRSFCQDLNREGRLYEREIYIQNDRQRGLCMCC